jgi:hypothetical protein
VVWVVCWGWDYGVWVGIIGVGVGIIRIYTKKLEFFPQMLGGNGGPHFCRVRGEGFGVMRSILVHSIEHELKRIFRGIRSPPSITRNIFDGSYFFSRFKN